MSQQILIYHRVLRSPVSGIVDEIDDKTFQSTMTLLNGFKKITSLRCIISSPSSILNKKIFITFDDGYRDNYEVALPILKKHESSATYFIASGYLNGGWMWNDGIIEAVAQT